MGLFSFVVGAGFGAGAMYWGSDAVRRNTEQIKHDMQQIRDSEEAIKEQCVLQLQEWERTGKIDGIMTYIKECNATGNYPSKSKLQMRIQ